ncbi:hypothetical protein PR003_g1284 [Phytophthora rubi]|uniref:Uncharacterized protein n=1 Tax=Phytophthora rubi TaxID=129364 RepID=A0A6A4G3U2_9STRA|nr:hypothetical protein PR003_g1284 [Phytophthora rubi]
MYIQLLFFQLKTHADFFEDEQETPEEAVALSKRASAAVLLDATVLVSLFSELLVGSIDGFATEMNVSNVGGMFAVRGAISLTRSGLSMVQCKSQSRLPPITPGEWETQFEIYM